MIARLDRKTGIQKLLLEHSMIEHLRDKEKHEERVIKDIVSGLDKGIDYVTMDFWFRKLSSTRKGRRQVSLAQEAGALLEPLPIILLAEGSI